MPLNKAPLGFEYALHYTCMIMYQSRSLQLRQLRMTDVLSLVDLANILQEQGRMWEFLGTHGSEQDLSAR